MIRKSQSRYPVVAKSHPGMSGKNNEDRFGVTAFQLSKKNPRQPVSSLLNRLLMSFRTNRFLLQITV